MEGQASSNLVQLDRRFNPGEFQTLLEIQREFGERKMVVEITETKSARAIRVMTDTTERGHFVAYLLDQLNRKQVRLDRTYPEVEAP